MSKQASATQQAGQPSLVDGLLTPRMLPLVTLLPALLLIYTLPHVIALRNLVILALLVLVAWSLATRRITLLKSGLKYPLLLVVVLQIWLLIISVFIAPDVFASLREWLGQWFKSAILFIVGIGAGLILAREISTRKREAVAAILVILPFAALALIHCALAVKYFSPEAFKTEYFGPSDHRANITYVAALGLPFVLIDISERLFHGRRLLPGSWYMPVTGLVLFLGAMLTSGTRNGVLVTAIVVAAWALWTLLQLVFLGRSRFALVLGVASGCTIAGAAAFTVSADPRWDTFVETAEIAWQTEKHAAWYRFQEVPLPRLKDGREVEESAFLRVAFLKEGTKLLLVHPWGTEVSRHAFRNLLAAKYGKVNVSHSHIGVIDFGLSAGFPGIAMWLMFLGSLGYAGWHEYSRQGNAMGLVLLFVVFTFLLRMFVDSTLREHILQQFMLVTGFLAAVAMPVKDRSKNV